MLLILPSSPPAFLILALESRHKEYHQIFYTVNDDIIMNTFRRWRKQTYIHCSIEDPPFHAGFFVIVILSVASGKF
jgi:hypothetical protein